MKTFAVVAGLLAVLVAPSVTSAKGDGIERREVNREQYDTLIAQCRYADTGKAKCRAAVKEQYRIGKTNRQLDCRTYAGVTVCGKLKLSRAERACARDSQAKGISPRRAEVECYAFT